MEKGKVEQYNEHRGKLYYILKETQCGLVYNRGFSISAGGAEKIQSPDFERFTFIQTFSSI